MSINFVFNRFYNQWNIVQQGPPYHNSRYTNKVRDSPISYMIYYHYKNESFFIIILLSTVQKIIPLYFIRNIFFSKALFFISIFLTRIFSAALLWTIVSIGKLLAISSIININWILIRTQISFKLVFLFIFIYLHLLLGLVLILNKNNSKTFIQRTNKIGTLDKVGIILIFMSLGGLPPLLGFLIKLVILKFILLKNNIILAIVLVFLSLILLFHYLSRSYYLLTMYPRIKFITKSSAGGRVFYFFYFFSLIWFNIVMVGTL